MIQEFKDFINKGNLVDLAVAFVLGTAFAALVKSFAEDIVGGILAYIGGDKVTDIKGLKAGKISYGLFLSAVVNFVIIAFVMFMVVKAYNKYAKQNKADGLSSTDTLLTEIKDLLGRR